jgi:hypothetical protein
MNNDACEISLESLEVARTARQFAAEVRRLRRSMRQCQSCENHPNCPVLIQFHAIFQAALEEVQQEMGLIPQDDDRA